MLLTTGHTSQGCGWWVATSTTPVGARPVKSIFMGYLFGFHELYGLGLGILFTSKEGTKSECLVIGRPNGLNIVISFVLLSYPPTLSWLLHGYCCMGAPLTINSLSSQIVLEVDEVCQQF